MQQGRIVVVTGAGGGIGGKIVERFLLNGDRVVGLDRSQSSLHNGFYPTVPFEEMTPAQWQETIAINLTGTFNVIHTLLPLMKSRGWGRIVNISSASIFEGVVGQTHYVAAKAGIVGLTRSLAMELGDYGITVNTVAPGLTLTEPVRRSVPRELLDVQREARALKRDEQPQDLAGPVFLLCSPDADFVSGQMLVIDGGKTKH